MLLFSSSLSAKKLIPIFSFILTLLTASQLRAQEFGGNPPSIKWNQINTKAAKVIYPLGLDSAAKEIANIVQQMNRAIQPTIGYKQQQISIVLQNQTTIANAYVGLAPFRSEFYLTPEQNSFDIGSLPWPKQLAIHEFRHVQQYNNFDVGLSRALHVLFGEGGQALGNELSIPNWFFEGDAVFNETLVSGQGRGRLPYFFSGYRALWAAGKDYSWMKLRNGSYRDFTPDWYPTGYMLVAYGREKYGDDFWKKVTQDAAAFKGGFYPLQHAIKKYSGADFETFRNDGLDHFKKQFSSDVKAQPLNKSEHFSANQEYPAYVNDSTLIYMKSTYDHLPVFVMKTGSKEKNISVRGLSLDNYFAYHNSKVVYASYRPDLRWTYRDYSELVVLDIATGEEHRITKDSKYFSPDFSEDGKTIVAVQTGPSGKSEVHLLDADSGKLISVVPNPARLLFTYPKFYGSAQLVSAVRTAKGQMSLALIDIKTGQPKYLLPFSYQPIGFIAVKKDTVYFTATSGIDDRLFALSISNNKLYELKNYRKDGLIGNYQPAVTNTKLAWVGFTAVGYQLSESSKKDLKWAEIKPELPGNLPDMGIAALKRDSAANLLSTINDEPVTTTKYPKSYHLLNFHSLIPTINDPNYSLALVGENVLNTFQSQLSFNYNRDEGYKQFGVDAVYGALFPFLSIGADYTLDRRGYYKGTNIYWNETDVHGGFEIPLNFSRGKNITGLYFGTDLYYSQTSFQSPFNTIFRSSNYTYLNYYLTFTNHIQQAKQNIYPRFGENISLNYKSAISGLSANQFLITGNLFLPGLMINHNLVINVAHQQKGGDGGFDFSNNFPFARGYIAENLHRLDKIGVNYHFPVAYPDAGLANTIYILRMRGNVFYDYTRGTDSFTDGSKFKNFRSTGAELFFDTQWFNQVPISFGFRYSYLADPDIFGGGGHNRFEIILPVTFF
ncbi:MAG TPA: hypothetical protein VK668_22920 [Mucilaginibacter sp.]|nr:hypothetical protein [Mucilaginibacter sp.]